MRTVKDRVFDIGQLVFLDLINFFIKIKRNEGFTFIDDLTDSLNGPCLRDFHSTHEEFVSVFQASFPCLNKGFPIIQLQNYVNQDYELKVKSAVNTGRANFGGATLGVLPQTRVNKIVVEESFLRNFSQIDLRTLQKVQ